MNLHDCAVPYTALPESVLALPSKIALIAAFEVYRSGCTASLENAAELSPYERRCRSEVTRELLRHGVIEETERGLAVLPLDMEADRTLAKSRIVIPACVDFRKLSPASIRVLLACYSLARYSRTPFQIELTQAELAARANVTRKSAGTATAQLKRERLIDAQKVWRIGTRISLLEPGSGVELFYLGRFYQQRLDSIPVFDRFKVLLQNFDPKNKLRDMRSVSGRYQVHCPFCTNNGKSTSFVFDVEADHWSCFNCRRSGDSARLWAKLEPWIDKTDWRQMVTASCGPVPTANDLEEVCN